jgi:hypothetical protein
MKRITAFHHPPPERPAETPDTQPGSYYVSARSGDKHWLLLGPFVDDHAAALRMVEPVRALANQHEPRSAFYAFGTCRYAPGETQPGSANRHFPECFGEKIAA